MEEGRTSGVSRRGVIAGASGASVLPALARAARDAPLAPGRATDVSLRVNGADHHLTIDPRQTLLDTLREKLDLTGAKKGCDHGQCGACTVHVDGRRVVSCLTLTATLAGREVTTIEGLAGSGNALHPMQAAFIAHDAFQCGYCTPGQIMSAVACVREGHARSDGEIAEYMSGNLCRCGAYPNIVTAVREAAGATKAA
ncbi:MAG TPA: (2Fe-2S)-binding protein [Caulobacteraceae bacterium]